MQYGVGIALAIGFALFLYYYFQYYRVRQEVAQKIMPVQKVEEIKQLEKEEGIVQLWSQIVSIINELSPWVNSKREVMPLFSIAEDGDRMGWDRLGFGLIYIHCSPISIGGLMQDWWTNPSFTREKVVLDQAFQAYHQGYYAQSIQLLVPPVYSIMREAVQFEAPLKGALRHAFELLLKNPPDYYTNGGFFLLADTIFIALCDSKKVIERRKKCYTLRKLKI